MLVEAVHELVVVQIAQTLELLAAHLALKRRLHVALHVAAQALLVRELLVTDGTGEQRVRVRLLVLLQLRFGVDSERAPLALVLAIEQATYELVLVKLQG